MKLLSLGTLTFVLTLILTMPANAQETDSVSVGYYGTYSTVRPFVEINVIIPFIGVQIGNRKLRAQASILPILGTDFFGGRAKIAYYKDPKGGRWSWYASGGVLVTNTDTKILPVYPLQFGAVRYARKGELRIGASILVGEDVEIVIPFPLVAWTFSL